MTARSSTASPPHPSSPPQEQKPREIEFAPMNFTISDRDRLMAYTGLPSYLRRMKDLEDATSQFWQRVEKVFHEVQKLPMSPKERSTLWRTMVPTLGLERLRQLVADYNRYLPAEANLPLDPSTGDYLLRGERFSKVEAPTPDDVFRRFVV